MPQENMRHFFMAVYLEKQIKLTAPRKHDPIQTMGSKAQLPREAVFKGKLGLPYSYINIYLLLTTGATIKRRTGL